MDEVVYTIDVLAESEEAWMFPCQLSQGEVSSVWLGLESHVTAITVELPDKSRIATESLGSG